MAETQPLAIVQRGINSLNTDSAPGNMRPGQARILENMVHTANNEVELRKGIQLYKSNAQWGEAELVQFIDFNLGAGAKELFALSDGRLYLNTLSTYVDSSTTFTEILSIASASPALNSSADNIAFSVLGPYCFITDNSHNLYRLDSSGALTLRPDPEGYEFSMTISNPTTDPTIGATYEDAALTTRKFIVTQDQSGTTLYLRQTDGPSRPGSTGTLTKLTGTGDSSITWSAISFFETYQLCFILNGRLILASNLGYLYISSSNDGNTFSGADSTFFPYGLRDNLALSYALNFRRGAILIAEDTDLGRSLMSTLTGYKIQDLAAPTDFDITVVDLERNLSAVGKSGQSIGNSFIMLTRSGFISGSAFQSKSEFGITTDSIISKDIQKLVSSINWDYAYKIISTLDLENQRYLCAVPFNQESFNNAIFAYDYKNSTPDLHKWSVFYYALDDNEKITLLYTGRNTPFLGTDKGNIYRTEIDDYYLDAGNSYVSTVELQGIDFGLPHKYKNFTDTALFFNVDEETPFKINAVIDEQIARNNFNAIEWVDIQATPKTLDTSNWSYDADDVWSYSPFDLWESSTGNEVVKFLTERLGRGRQLSLKIQNIEGGKRWKLSGYYCKGVDVGRALGTDSLSL